MNIKDNIKPVELNREIKLHGHCVLEAYKDGKLAWREEHDNTVTPYAENLINKGNFFNTIPTNKILPLFKMFSGVQLLSKTGDATKMTIPADADVIACAGDSSYNVSNDDLRRGTFNVDSSEPILGAGGRITGYKFVWNWVDTRGNSPDASTPFKAVCLTRPKLAVARPDALTVYDQHVDEVLATLATTERLAKCQIIDYENGRAFWVRYSSSKILIDEYQLNTKQFGIVGVYNSSGVYDVTAQVGETHEITPDTAPNDYNVQRASVSFVGGKIHFITYKNTTIIDNVIDPADDYSVTSTTYTYDLGTGITIRTLDTGNSGIPKDGVLLTSDGAYFWLVGSDSKFYKCNLSNVADVSDGYPMVANNYANNGVFAELPNGDWIKFSFRQDNVTAGITVNYYHNDFVYGAKCTYNAPAGYGVSIYGVNVTPYGTALYSMPYSGRYAGEYYLTLNTLAGYVSTVWNIAEDDRIKTAGMDMRCIYTLTET